ncbi:hypothetical protein SESBI_33790 [Sesbania bispinosa]|nr:hypothetical protein SESBI_33790 [Sesbania bispinosa]
MESAATTNRTMSHKTTINPLDSESDKIPQHHSKTTNNKQIKIILSKASECRQRKGTNNIRPPSKTR